MDKNLKDLLELIKEHPDYPIIPCVYSEVVADDSYNTWLGSWGAARVATVLSTKEYGLMEDDDIDDIFEKFFEWDECGIDNAMPLEKIEEIKTKWVKTLPWKTVILVNIDLPTIESV